MGTITVTNLGKAYKQYPNRWSRLLEWVVPASLPRHQLNWVLDGLNFTVSSGEALGIIGINGAGKSTLLKMISGTTQPTRGKVSVSGRVAALLELGMGFHPDFTGRQNIYMAGQLLGYSLDEIKQFMPEIEAFAEIGDYLDQPIRIYSSGMQMRLAFSVATARRPDVLIIDEALSVGDAYFQHKSFERIRQFRQAGTTLLLVSHDKEAIQAICDRAILLNNGRLAVKGKPEEVLDYYNALLADHHNQTIQQHKTLEGVAQTVSGTGEATVTDIGLLNMQGQRISLLEVGQPVILSVQVKTHVDLERLVLGYAIKDRLGQVIFGTNTHLRRQPLNGVEAHSCLKYDIFFNACLGPGVYSIQTALTRDDSHILYNYEWKDRALIFEVVNVNKLGFVGTAWIEPEIHIEKL